MGGDVQARVNERPLAGITGHRAHAHCTSTRHSRRRSPARAQALGPFRGRDSAPPRCLRAVSDSALRVILRVRARVPPPCACPALSPSLRPSCPKTKTVSGDGQAPGVAPAAGGQSQARRCTETHSHLTQLTHRLPLGFEVQQRVQVALPHLPSPGLKKNQKNANAEYLRSM